MWSQPILKYPFVLLTAFVVTYVLTAAVRRLAPCAGFMDIPHGRHGHARPTPRAGGIAVFLGFHAGCAAVFLMPWIPFGGLLTPTWWWRYLLLSSALLALGLVDDRRGLRARVKLAGQVVVALAAYSLDMQFSKVFGYRLPFLIDLLATVFWIVAIINAFNLIDGMDGLAAGLAMIAAFGLAGALAYRHLPGDTLVALGLAGACLAFLRFNFYPASIFLGDSGSMFLGFTLAAIALGTGYKDAAVATIVVPLLAVGVPVLDTALAVWRRSARSLLQTRDGARESARLFEADRDHLHHRLERGGRSPRAIASLLYLLGVALVAVGLLSMIFESQAAGIYILAFVGGTYVAVRHLVNVELWDSGRVIARGVSRPPNRVMAVILYPIADLVALGAALAIAIHFATPDAPRLEFRRFWFDHTPIWVGLPFIGLLLARTYRRVWSRARIAEYVLLAAALVSGILIAAGIAALTGQFDRLWSVYVMDVHLGEPMTLVLGRPQAQGFVQQILIYTGTALSLVLGLRAIPHAVQDVMGWVLLRRDADNPAARRILLCGADYRCALFLHERSFRQTDTQDPVHIVGLLDDDRNLHGRYVHGHRVWGGLQAAEACIRKHRVDEIVVLDRLSDTARRELEAVSARTGIRLSEWRTSWAALSPAAAAPNPANSAGLDGAGSL